MPTTDNAEIVTPKQITPPFTPSTRLLAVHFRIWRLTGFWTLYERPKTSASYVLYSAAVHFFPIHHSSSHSNRTNPQCSKTFRTNRCVRQHTGRCARLQIVTIPDGKPSSSRTFRHVQPNGYFLMDRTPSKIGGRTHATSRPTVA